MKTSITILPELGRFGTTILKGIYQGNTPHISEWRTTTSNETVTLPYTIGGTYTGLIDWGDGTQSVNNYENRTHNYATPGYYTITIYGIVSEFRFNNSGDRTKIYRIFQWGSQFYIGNNNGYFYGCTNLNLSVVSDVLIFNSTNTNGDFFFRDCTSLTTINRSNEWNVSSFTSFISVFFNCVNFNSNISSWNVENVTYMTGMFRNTAFNQPIGNWNVSNTTSINNMFRDAVAFNQSLNNWSVSNVTLFNDMFFNATSFNQPLNLWNVLNATTMQNMFRGATAFNQNIGNWDVRNCLNFTNFMFGKTFSNYSTANYNALLIGWASRPVKPNISINFGTIKRTIAGTAARLVLTSAPNLWTIVDGGI
jgi:surface protein